MDYVVDRRAYRDFIENISRQGAFISTQRPISPGTKLVMTFTWKKTGQFIKSNGIVIRKNRKGFAVVFPQPLAIQQDLQPESNALIFAADVKKN